jgi:hypothetical protein
VSENFSCCICFRFTPLYFFSNSTCRTNTFRRWGPAERKRAVLSAEMSQKKVSPTFPRCQLEKKATLDDIWSFKRRWNVCRFVQFLLNCWTGNTLKFHWPERLN